MMAIVDTLLLVNSDVLLKIVTACVALYVLVRFLGLSKKRRNYPPGPTGLPIVGYFPFLTDKPHEKFEQLRKKYGNIFSFYLGNQYTVILSDVDSTREAFVRDEFHGRPEKNVLAPGVFTANVSNTNGRDWQEQRKLMFHALKGAGRGNDFVEEVVKGEIQKFLSAVENSRGNPLDFKEYLSTGVSNILTRLAFGKTYENDSPSRAFLNHCIQQIVIQSSQVAAQNFFPWIGKTPIINKCIGWDKYLKSLRQLKDFFEQEIDEHEKTLDPHNVRDFIDACLIQEKKAKEQGQYTSLTREALCGNMQTLLGAGSETVRTSLQWMFYALVAYPQVQKNIQKEIDEVLGREKEPSWSDQKDMPYTMSVIMEVQRLFTIVPLNVFHYTVEDTKVQGYDIPKGTMVISNLWAIMRDPSEWEKPNEFIPERFLDKTRKNILRQKSYLPFSIGKRICPGESLANQEMFLFLSATLQKYDIRPPTGKEVNLKPEFYITTQPECQDLCFTERH